MRDQVDDPRHGTDGRGHLALQVCLHHPGARPVRQREDAGAGQWGVVQRARRAHLGHWHAGHARPTALLRKHRHLHLPHCALDLQYRHQRRQVRGLLPGPLDALAHRVHALPVRFVARAGQRLRHLLHRHVDTLAARGRARRRQHRYHQARVHGGKRAPRGHDRAHLYECGGQLGFERVDRGRSDVHGALERLVQDSGDADVLQMERCDRCRPLQALGRQQAHY
mmetsp:Transcript_22628/g.45732  ORF Transcript_22628/g.45732 Transcript_22628/m.45732 type:complete len:224 (+) Transcript_22628:4285-4956(+)